MGTVQFLTSSWSAMVLANRLALLVEYPNRTSNRNSSTFMIYQITVKFWLYGKQIASTLILVLKEGKRTQEQSNVSFIKSSGNFLCVLSSQTKNLQMFWHISGHNFAVLTPHEVFSYGTTIWDNLVGSWNQYWGQMEENFIKSSTVQNGRNWRIDIFNPIKLV